MESEDELKETGNRNRTCYYFDDTMKTRILGIFFLDKKIYRDILSYYISYKTIPYLIQ